MAGGSTMPDGILPIRHPYHFPWRAGNRFGLLIDGPRFLPAMLEAIAGARRYVLLELYLFESGAVTDRFIEAFAAAARRRVDVRLLLDDFGARGLGNADRERLRLAGVELVFYNPLRTRRLFANLARDHRKLLLVDGDVAFVGGAGLTDEFDPPGRPGQRWRETVLRIEGPVLADWQRLFEEIWNRYARTGLDLPLPAMADLPSGVPGRVTVARGAGSQEIQRDIIKRVRMAGRRAWIMTAYFVPSWRLKRALKQRRASRRGRAPVAARADLRPPRGAPRRAALLCAIACGRRAHFRVSAAIPARQGGTVRRLGLDRFEQPRPLGIALEPRGQSGDRGQRHSPRRCKPCSRPISRKRSSASTLAG